MIVETIAPISMSQAPEDLAVAHNGNAKLEPPVQRRPNRRLKQKSSLNTLTSDLGSSLNSSVMSAPSMVSSTTTASFSSSPGSISSSFTGSTRRPFSGSLRDRRGLAASTGGSVRISFTQYGGLDSASMREIIAGFDSDSEDDSSVDSYVAELRKKQVVKDSKGPVTFANSDVHKDLGSC